MSKYTYLFKIVIIGDHNCGKSCILLRYADGKFRDDHVSTLGVDFKLKTLNLDSDKIRLELWDTAGLERYRTIYNSYYHSAHGVMCVYDISDKRSFENVRNYWLSEVRKHAPANAVLMLVGNKCDLRDPQRSVEFTTAEAFAADSGVSLFEVSAKTGINVDAAFSELAAAMRERLLISRACGSYYGDTLPMDNWCSNSIGGTSSSDELSSGFHVDGVVSSKTGDSATAACCFGGGTKNGTTYL